MSNLHFNNEQDLMAMKQDIADRAFSIKLKGMVITGLFAAVALGALFVFPAALGAAAPLVALAGMAGGTIAGLATLKETKKLQIDEQYLESRLQGGNWWGGYRREVMDHGGHAPATPMVGHPHSQQMQR